jgi:rubrerythrin
VDEDAVRFWVPPSQAMPKRVFLICHYCGYSPKGDVPESGSCPKCGGFSWERFALPEPLIPEHMK